MLTDATVFFMTITVNTVIGGGVLNNQRAFMTKYHYHQRDDYDYNYDHYRHFRSTFLWMK